MINTFFNEIEKHIELGNDKTWTFKSNHYSIKVYRKEDGDYNMIVDCGYFSYGQTLPRGNKDERKFRYYQAALNILDHIGAYKDMDEEITED